jgi:hypothetical protein
MSAEKTMRPIQPAVRCLRRGKKNERLKSVGEKFLSFEKSEEYLQLPPETPANPAAPAVSPAPARQ